MLRSLTSVRVQKHLDTREEGASVRERQSVGSLEVEGPREHASVLLRETISLLALTEGDKVIDGTAGQGGHSEAILKEAPLTLLALDADPTAVAFARERLATFGDRAQVVEGNFADIERIAQDANFTPVTKVLLDLGWNMGQLKGKGLSFLADEPLNMSYGQRPASGFTAAEILNTWQESAIADALFGYGEERYARRIAKEVVSRREEKPFETTFDFVDAINASVPGSYRHGKIHPATRSFQALRIAVNDELGVLTRALEAAWRILKPGGRIAVITFHSIEDRLVKRIFAEWVKQKEGTLTTKKPITATEEELTTNRPSRSAKLRGIEKIWNKK